MRLTLMLPAVLALATAVPAQPPEPTLAAPKTDEPTATIPLQHVPATLIQRWIVPQKQAGVKAGARARTGGVFELPEGVREVLPPEAETELRVRATPEGLRQLRQIVELLDRPLRHVVVQVRVLKIERDALRQLPGDWAINGPSSWLGFARGKFDETLRKMVDDGKATEELDEAGLIVNNTTGALSGPRPSGLMFGVRLTPTINNDNSVTMLMQFDASFTSVKPSMATSVVNARDRDTTMVAIPPAGDKATRLTLALITPRIVPLTVAR